MGNWLLKMERKFGRYSIQNLTLILICSYAIGYVIKFLFPAAQAYLVLNPYQILHGQVWRIVSWLLIPPDSSSIFFTVIMLYFYLSIGRSLENVWGDFRYNVYIFSGIIFTIIGAFALYGVGWIMYGDEIAAGTLTADSVFTYSAYVVDGVSYMLPGYWFYNVSTYYISMSIFLAYAFTFPENRVLLMFLFPIRVKILGYIYGGFIALEILQLIMYKEFYTAVIIVCSLLNFIIFFLSTKNISHFSPNDLKRRADYRKKVQWAKINSGHEATHEGRTVITKHKCAICGKTELSGEDLEFRFCSKCNGNYEYCNEHLFSHEHVRRI